MENLDKVYAKRIAEEYAPKTSSKVVRLKKLDQKVKRPAEIFAYIFGIVSTLSVCAGMSIVLTNLRPGGAIGLVVSVLIGVVGLAICGVNYPIYSEIIKVRREKYSFEITKLAKEISEE